MPIKGLSQQRRWQRAGKIHLGVMVQTGSKSYPRATDYFVVPDEIRAIHGDQPKVLPIFFTSDDPEAIFPQWYKAYNSGGLFCKGDGESAKRWVEGNLKMIECTCPLLEQGKCSPVATLNFFVDKVPGLGVYQIDTSNKQSIQNINSGLEQFARLFGGLAGIPFLLRLEPVEVQRIQDGKPQKTTIFAMRLDSEHTLREIHTFRLQQGAHVPALMPHEDDEDPLDRALPERAEVATTAEIVNTATVATAVATIAPAPAAQAPVAEPKPARTRRSRQEPAKAETPGPTPPPIATAPPVPAEAGEEMDFGATTASGRSIDTRTGEVTDLQVMSRNPEADARPTTAVAGTATLPATAADPGKPLGGRPAGSIEACFYLTKEILGIAAKDYTMILNWKWKEGVDRITDQHLAEEWALLEGLAVPQIPKHILDTVKSTYRVQWAKAKAAGDKK